MCVPEGEGQKALRALEKNFELELARSTVNSVSLMTGMCVVAIIGEGMCEVPGVTAKFMSALADANVNIRLIAQGSSERQVAVVVDGEDESRALRAVHMAFTLSETVASVSILGTSGRLGQELLAQLDAQRDSLREDLKIEVRPIAATTSSAMVLDDTAQGLDLDKVQAALAEFPQKDDDVCETDGICVQELDMGLLTDFIEADVNPHRIIVDCTASTSGISANYERWLGKGVNIICPSKGAVAGPLEQYKAAKHAARRSGALWQYESAVGAALPIVGAVRDLLETGDTVKSINGCVSGTLAYVLKSIEEDGTTFSAAVKKAVDLGYTEPDVREDLTGLDMAEKAVTMARECGLELSIEDVAIEGLIPQDLATKSFPDDMKATEVTQEVLKVMGSSLDEAMAEKLKEAKAEDKVLRYSMTVDVEKGTASVGLKAVDITDPLFRLKDDENLVSFTTGRYNKSPLIVKGSAAGAELAASGIFADILRLARVFSRD